MTYKPRFFPYSNHSVWKKVLSLVLLFVLFFSISYTNPSYGAEAAIRSIHVTVDLQDDGSALITQVWDVTVTDGTEYYIPQTNLDDMEIKNFTVYDETGRRYRDQGDWDTDRSLEEKAGTSGINQIDNGLELCWGVGSYGDHIYTLHYTLTNLIKAYPDSDGFNSRFINDQLSSPVQEATVTILKQNHPFTLEEVRMWAFGFDGDIQLQDGKIIAKTTSPLNSSNHMTIMTAYEKGLFHPLVEGSGSFEDIKVNAFQGSDYESSSQGGNAMDNNPSPPIETDSSEILPNLEGPSSPPTFFFHLWGLFAPILIVLAGFILALVFGLSKKTATFSPGLNMPQYSEMDYYRNIPCDGNIPGCLYGLSLIGSVDDKDLLSAYILRWIRSGVVQVQKSTRSRLLGLGKIEESSLVLDGADNLKDTNEKVLYTMMLEASKEDGILQEKEFRDWSRSNYTRLQSWIKQEYKIGRQFFREIQAVEVVEKKRFFGLIPYEEDQINQKGVMLLEQLLGFKKYLTDFTLINERETKEVQLWDDYLVIAALYGMADKVSQEMNALYPNFNQESAYYHSNTNMLTTLSMVNALSHAGQSGMQSGMSSSSSGSGGSSSFGGGGGFSGGGSGGGSR